MSLFHTETTACALFAVSQDLAFLLIASTLVCSAVLELLTCNKMVMMMMMQGDPQQAPCCRHQAETLPRESGPMLKAHGSQW